MATRWLGRALMAAGVWALSTAGAWALPLTLTVVGQGLQVANQNYGCPAGPGSCLLAGADFNLSAPAPASGSIVLNDARTVASIFINVASVTFVGPSSSTTTFAALEYRGDVALQPGTGDVVYFQSFATPSTGTVSGTANGIAFARSAGIFNLNCAVPGGEGQCSLTYGETGFTDVAGHDWVHTLNLTIPEPASALLVALGLACSVLLSRRA